jgi:hypothetical protein
MKAMKNYQDTETGKILAFDDGVDPFKLNNRNIPITLSETVIQKPSGSHMWFKGDWVKDTEVPEDYKPPVSSVPAYNPAWVVFLQPYTFIHASNEDKLSISLDQINANSYENEKLSKVIGTLPINGSGIHALLSYDGAIACPRNAEYPSNESAIDVLNRMLCAILLGGIHTKVVSHPELCSGTLHDGMDVFVHDPSIHTQLRHKWASVPERMQLMHPRVLSLADLTSAYLHGITVIDSIDNFSPFFLLHGYTAMVNQNRSDALSSLWIVVEQLTWFIWNNKFMRSSKFHPSIAMKSRKDSMKQDNRTWPISVKHEILWQIKLISDECYSALALARKQRNDLVHEGKIPEFSAIEGLWRSLSELFHTASGINQEKMHQLAPIEIPDFGFQENNNFDEWVELSKKFNH